ncbi:MAG: hypothetical protein U1E02_12490 [Hydrogenophaga sp.]|nr:hypothetical protein [Hydrogenophaga sp.]
MKHVLTIATVTITAFLAGCATAPAEPTAQMSPIDNYANMDCQQLNTELKAVSTWENHHTDMNTYLKDTSSFMQTMDVIGAVLGAVGSAVDPSMSGMYQANTKSSTLATAQVESSQAQAAAHQAGLAKRRSALGKLMAINGCR